MNRENFEKLASYLENLPQGYTGFEMSVYAANGFEPDSNWWQRTVLSVGKCSNPDVYRPGCGTVACAIGHGPAAGIGSDMDSDNWIHYVEAHFCMVWSDVYAWCFDSDWHKVDNTHQGAAKRIRWMLAHDGQVPPDFIAQLRGDAPLCYQ